MDYLDVKKEQRHNILLLLGYGLVAVAITIATLVLLYQAYGFGLAKNGTVVQDGLIFFSSQPSPANIYTNGKLQPKTTNTRMTLEAGIYDVTLARQGYHDWQRKIEISGGGVQRFDYPFLIPKQLETRDIENFEAAPGLVTQSSNRRWLVTQPSASLTALTVYDLDDPEQEPTPLNLPAGLLSAGTAQTWQALEWADDNRHFLLQHNFDGRTEFILVDRSEPELSVNLNQTLGVEPTKLEFINRKYDQYYAYNTADSSLRRLRLEGASGQDPVFQRVLAYKSYGDDTLLYVTDTGAPAGKVVVKLSSGARTWNIRQFTAGSSYVVDLTRYSGDIYVAAGSAADNKAYVYRDPARQLDSSDIKFPGPVQVMHVAGVNFLSFSSSAQFIAAQNGNRFGVYDIENKVGYNYTTAEPLDRPQAHASWMDGNRLLYVSGGRLLMFDYDYTNKRTLSPGLPAFKPAFDPNYEFLYMIAPQENGRYGLAQTALLTTADR